MARAKLYLNGFWSAGKWSKIQFNFQLRGQWDIRDRVIPAVAVGPEEQILWAERRKRGAGYFQGINMGCSINQSIIYFEILQGIFLTYWCSPVNRSRDIGILFSVITGPLSSQQTKESGSHIMGQEGWSDH